MLTKRLNKITAIFLSFSKLNLHNLNVHVTQLRGNTPSLFLGVSRRRITRYLGSILEEAEYSTDVFCLFLSL